MIQIFKIGETLESGNTYIADKEEYHIYLEDTQCIESKRYLSLHKSHGIDNIAGTECLNVFIEIKNKKDITIDFCGAVLVFHGKIQPFVICDSENITIKNCAVAYFRAPYTEFIIEERGENYVALKKCDKNATFYVENGRLIMTGENWENRDLYKTPCFFQAFDMKTREGKGMSRAIVGREVKRNEADPFEQNQLVPSMCGELLKLEGKLWDSWTKGTLLCYAHEKRTLASVYTFGGSDITIENYRLINGAGMGISTNHTKNVYIRGLKLIYDEKSNGIITNAADAIHSISCSGDYVIADSVLEGMVDDGLNIHGVFCTFKSAENNTMYIKNSGHTSAYLEFFSAGEKIAVYNGPTMEKSAEYTVKAFEIIDEDNIKLKTEETIGKHNEGDLIESLSAQSNITIKNCSFGKANSHIRFQSRGKILVEDTEIGLPVLLSGDASFWFESSPVQALTFKNVVFNTAKAEIRLMPEVMPTEKEPYYHKNVKFIDCEFVSDTPVRGGYTDNIVFDNVTNSAGKAMKMILTNCGRVDAEGVELERHTEVKTKLQVN